MARPYGEVADASLGEQLITTEDAGGSGGSSESKQQHAETGDPMPCTPREFCFWVWRNPTERVGVLVYVLASVVGLIIAIMALISIAQNIAPTSTFITLSIIELLIFGFAAYSFRRSIALREQVQKFAKLNNDFKKENGELRAVVDRMHKACTELNDTHDTLSRLNAKNKENIQKFTQLQSNLAKFAGGNLEGMGKLKEQTEKMSASWRESLVKNERSLVFRIYEEIQDREGADDLTEAQFNQAMEMLPPDYKAYFDTNGGTWLEMAGDDGMMQYDEFMAMCDLVIDERVSNDIGAGDAADGQEEEG